MRSPTLELAAMASLALTVLHPGPRTTTGVDARSRTVVYLVYNGRNLDKNFRVPIYRGVTANVMVRGSLLDLSTGVEVRTASGAPTTAVQAAITERVSDDHSNMAVNSNAHIVVRLTTNGASALGGYRVLIHYVAEVNGPDGFDVVLNEHGSVGSISVTSPTRADGSYLVGEPITLHVTGTGLQRARLLPQGLGMTQMSAAPLSDGEANFTVRFDSTGQVRFPAGAIAFDGAEGAYPMFGCPFACYSGTAQLTLMLRKLPQVTSVSPSVVSPGSSVTLSGTFLRPDGYSPRVTFVGKYRSPSVTTPVILVPTSSGLSDLSVLAPAGIRSDSIRLSFAADASSFHRDSLASADVPIVGLLVRSGPPAIQFVDSAGPAGLRHAVLTVGSSKILKGQNFVPDPDATIVSSGKTGTVGIGVSIATLPTITFGGTPMSVQFAGYRAGSTAIPGQIGVDSATFTVPAAAFSDTTTRDLVLTTPAGSAAVHNVMFVPPPTVTEIRSFDQQSGVDVPLASGAPLVRGKQYHLRGRGLVVALRSSSDIMRASLNGVVLGVSLTDAREPVITIPAAATSGPLVVTAEGGQTTVGTFAVVDPPSGVNIVGLSLSPATVTGGRPITATVAINGSIPVGGSAGTLAFSLATPDAAVVLPPAPVPITANPMVVTIPTRAIAAQRGVTLRVSNDPNAAQLDLNSATLTLLPPAPTSVTWVSPTVVGGTTTRAIVHVNTTATASDGLTVTLTNSDPTTATIPASAPIIGDSAVVTVSTQIPPVDRPITITATVGGASSSATITVKAPVLSAVSVQPSSVMSGASQATATLTLSGVLATPTTATIACDAALTCPASVALAAGQSSASFSVSASAVSAAVVDTVRVTLNGVAQRGTITITPLAIQALTLSPTTVAAGVNTSLTVQLNAPVPVGQSATVTITSSDATVHVPAGPVTFAAGDQTKLVTLTTVGPVAAPKAIQITATFAIAGVTPTTRSVALAVTP
jgi:hypothetical protein